MAEAWDKKPQPKFDRTIWTEHLAWRFRIKKTGEFRPHEPPFERNGSRLISYFSSPFPPLSPAAALLGGAGEEETSFLLL